MWTTINKQIDCTDCKFEYSLIYVKYVDDMHVEVKYSYEQTLNQTLQLPIGYVKELCVRLHYNGTVRTYLFNGFTYKINGYDDYNRRVANENILIHVFMGDESPLVRVNETVAFRIEVSTKCTAKDCLICVEFVDCDIQEYNNEKICVIC